MKKILLILTLLLFTYSTAQRTISLEEETSYLTTGRKIPNDVTYIKDISGIFDKFNGTWKGVINGNTIEFKFNKIIDGNELLKRDMLLGRIIATDANGNILYNTSSNPDNLAFAGYRFSKNMKIYSMTYEGPKSVDCNEGGYIYMLMNNDNIRLKFIAESGLLKENQCPQGYKFLIPTDTTVTLTKQ
ncbi:DUF6705 family protein [Elizabethkingia anophelis]|uniref:DUF6705 family protein n=1 Tax=Elizabethkingia anophelis TaxID=1117645 RepID=UPI00136AE498|nr:DUF6705 family protein [Elizabethkingia anophelis]MCL1034921.1 hypothetical protein [Elizabethkingia anophelis]MDV3751325.1 hypothetical protein [Elizabethkingia anophelis]MDV3953354.1 hypothetical protein [Elizabethkingia anophelis]MYY25721.1 hypothetical protein [Elizabethkingia anophelis]